MQKNHPSDQYEAQEILNKKISKHCKKMKDFLKKSIYFNNGYLSFDSWMQKALYAPSLGYYETEYLRNRDLDIARNFIHAKSSSDFVTGPELTPLFGQTLALQVAQILEFSSSENILELGAGTGALAGQLLYELHKFGVRPKYKIIEISENLKLHQKNKLLAFKDSVSWISEIPENFCGCIIGNEFLDALPVSLFCWSNNGKVMERGVGVDCNDEFIWINKNAKNSLSELVSNRTHPMPGYASEINRNAEGWIQSISKSLKIGGVIFLDYGFPRAEYYHPQRNAGTLMCHFRHHAYSNPLLFPGIQDITAHVDFSSIAESGIQFDLDILGYTSQARFLINSGILDKITLIDASNVKKHTQAISSIQTLLLESEMGELFKVIVLGRGIKNSQLIGFTRGDRTHTL